MGKVIAMNIRTYSELITLPTFKERYDYCRIGGSVGKETFGFNRYLNQIFYNSLEWKRFRREIILRDMGCDLGIADREIVDKIYIHHLNPVTIDDIRLKRLDVLINPENAICSSDNTHKAIHYSDETLLFIDYVERTKYDTCPWRR